MASLDVDTVNIHQFLIGGNSTLHGTADVHVIFYGFSHTWTNALFIILLVLIVLDYAYHVVELCKNCCTRDLQVQPKAQALLSNSDMMDVSETVV